MKVVRNTFLCRDLVEQLCFRQANLQGHLLEVTDVTSLAAQVELVTFKGIVQPFFLFCFVLLQIIY